MGQRGRKRRDEELDEIVDREGPATKIADGRLYLHPDHETILQFLRDQIWRSESERTFSSFRNLREKSLLYCLRIIQKSVDPQRCEPTCVCSDIKMCVQCRKLRTVFDTWLGMEKIMLERARLEGVIITRAIEKMGGLQPVDLSGLSEDSATMDAYAKAG